MNFKDYKEMMNTIPFTETLGYCQAVMWLHPETLPLGVISIGDKNSTIIKIPGKMTNRYGNKVPVIAIARDAFINHDKITDIVLPPSIQRIPVRAFAGCSELRRITIPKQIKLIGKGTFADCDKLEDVYYEGSREEWEKVNIVHNKHEIELGDLIPGTSINEIKAERLLHVPGNDALLTANIHFNCNLSDLTRDSEFESAPGGKDITDLFKKY